MAHPCPRRRAAALALLAGLGLHLPFRALAAEPAAACTEPAAKFASIEGRVEVSADAGRWQAATIASRLCPGDSIRVDTRSRAAIVLANAAIMRLDQNTTMRLTQVLRERTGRGVIDILKGAVQTFIRKPSSLSVSTPYLNGSIEGTEFQVVVGDGKAGLEVMEGRVRVSNAGGEVVATGGMRAEATATSAPVLSPVVHPLDAVQWTLYFPPLLSADAAPPALRPALQAYQDGDAAAALAALDPVAPAARDGEWRLAQAALLLAVGRADEALPVLDTIRADDGAHARAQALRAMLQVLRNENDAALDTARAALAAEDSAAARLALSYALQARFRLEDAGRVVREGTERQPRDALLWARLGELELMLGDAPAATAAAATATSLAPTLARPQIVSGFVALARYDLAAARRAFEQALARTPADPLPHLGLGLVLIGSGERAAGRGELEIAIALDPNQALLRAYLGKAYAEEGRSALARQQFDIATTLDPLDPTAFLYSGLDKRTTNQPIEAIDDIRASIARNDNRAVYRSRLLLDRDRATRSAGLAGAFQDAGFEQAGLAAASDSLGADPGDASAHQFLSEIYGGTRRREIARVSELLQAQMLQDDQAAPLLPSAGEANLNLSAGGGAAGYNEFSSLFARDRLSGTATFGGGNLGSRGGEAAISGVEGPLSFGLGVLDWRNDGWRPNNDVRQLAYTAFAQAALDARWNVQAEYRHRNSAEGDLAFNFDPASYVQDRRIERAVDSARLGLRFTPNAGDRLLVSLLRSWRRERLDELQFLPSDGSSVTTFSNRVRSHEAANQAEVQYLADLGFGTLIGGVAWADVKRHDGSQVSIDDSVFGNLLSADGDSPLPSSDVRGYLYLKGHVPKSLLWTLGTSVERFRQQGYVKYLSNPKLGLQWNLSETVALRAAALQTLKPSLVANRSLEPTQLSGFNQLFDDLNGTRSRLYGLGADWQASAHLRTGVEATRRDLSEPLLIDGGFLSESRRESSASAYWNWAPLPRLALTGSLVLDRYLADPGIVTQSGLPLQVFTRSIPLGIGYFDPSGLSAGLKLNLVAQTVDRDPVSGGPAGRDRFAVVDLTAGYRLPQRWGRLRVSVRNLFDTRLRYQDDSYREFRDEPSVGPYFPTRQIVARYSVDF